VCRVSRGAALAWYALPSQGSQVSDGVHVPAGRLGGVESVVTRIVVCDRPVRFHGNHLVTPAPGRTGVPAANPQREARPPSSKKSRKNYRVVVD
jgi:hypothetical protein